MSEPRTDWIVATSPLLQSLVIEASVTGSSQGVLSVDLRRRIDAEVARMLAEARADALRDAAAAVGGLREAAQEVSDSIPATYDEDDPMVQRHARALNALPAALAAIRALGER